MKTNMMMRSGAVLIFLVSQAVANVDYSLIGFGANRLIKNDKNLKEETSCANVEVFRYTEAIIDNFAPIEKVEALKL